MFQSRPLGGPIQLAQVHDLMPGTPLALGLVHGRVRVLDKLLGKLVASTREGDTHARRHGHGATREFEGRRDRIDDPGSDRVDLCRLVQVFAEDDELVAGQASQRIARPQGDHQAFGNGDQQLVTDGVAVQVVH